MFNTAVPYVLEGKDNERVLDLWSRLHKDRIVFLGDTIDDHVANVVAGQFLQLEAADNTAPIYLYINSPGGNVSAGLCIYDLMNYLSCPVYTFCIGVAASMAAVLLSSGEKGHRYCLPNASVMIHQVRGGTQGTVVDMRISMERALYLNDKLVQILANNTGQDIETIKLDVDRDKWFSGNEAVEYGLVDTVLSSRKDEE